MDYTEDAIQEGFYPAYTDPAQEAARNIFGVPSLYPWQRLVIANIMEAAESGSQKNAACAGTNNEDIYNKGKQIVLLPTGAGKSMCFMIPAILFDCPTLIIYPLLSLISDQLRRMEKAGLETVVFRGQQTAQEREQNFRKLECGTKIILANPEVLQSEELIERLKLFNIIHAAIDEAHCIADWGDSFRPAYLTLGGILRKLQIPVITAFTATASPPVLERIQDVLFTPEKAYMIRSAADRQNILYRVRRSCVKQKTVLQLAETEERPIIIFCGTRLRSEKTAYLISERFGKDAVKFYHAGLTKEEKKTTEAWFYPRKDAILCCTCAFGMGVDKPDIRTVIHLEPSPSVEAYVQEAGRAGRDGKPAQAVLLWSPEDSLQAKNYPENSRKRILSHFAESKNCRRQILLDALAAEQTACSGCDICESKESGKQPPLLSGEEELTISVIRRNQNRWTCNETALFMAAKMNKESAFKIWEPDDFIHIIKQMLKEKRIAEIGLLQTKKLTMPNNAAFKAYRLLRRMNPIPHRKTKQLEQPEPYTTSF